ncbi:MAG TPA: SIS domain-containing protein [Anaerolineales bacterium]|nr:SIS domain-containing protein [Anaerolineales bacterium]
MSLYTEIMEQPGVIGQLLAGQWKTVQSVAAEIRKRQPGYAFLAARGTSDNAGRYANYLWGAHNRLPVALATPSLFTFYRQPPLLGGAMVVGISQSGKSPDIVRVIEEGKSQGCLTLTMTNVPDSPLAGAADFVVDLQCGEEKAVAATKTYTAELAAIAMLSVALAEDESRLTELHRTPDWMRQALALDAEIARLAERYRYMERCAVVGRGFNYCTAFEWSLKIKELTYVTAEPYSSADFRHGPIAIVEQGFPMLVIVPGGKVFEDVLELLKILREKGAELVVISDQSDALELAHSPFQLPSGIPEWLTPLIAILPAQLFAYHLTRVKGYNTEAPRSILKVTETH